MHRFLAIHAPINDMDTQMLEQVGLTGGESRVYLAMLDLGPSTVGPIVEKSKVSRSIIYRLLDNLMEKGLASYIIEEKTKHYSAAGPERILEYMDRQRKQLEESRLQMQKMLPLLAQMTSPKRNDVRVFKGFRGLITMHEQLYLKLKKGDEYLSLGVPAEQEERFHSFWKEDHKRREKLGITCRLLFHTDTDDKVLANRNSYWGCDARRMGMKIDAPAWWMVYKDVTSIVLQSKELITVEITNQEIADSYRNYFESFWKNTKPFSKERKGKKNS